MDSRNMKLLSGGKHSHGTKITMRCQSCGAEMEYSTEESEQMIKEYEDIFGLKFSPDDVAIVCSNCRDKLFN